MPKIPFDTNLESTLPFLRDPYRFISKKCKQLRSDIFEARILFQRTICIRGQAAAELFYDPQRFQRRGAIPTRFEKTLFGRGGVQELDGEDHRHRKQMFVGLMTPGRIRDLENIVDRWWQLLIRKWHGRPQIVLYTESQELLCRAICEWAGVPLPEADVSRRIKQLVALFDAAGSVGPKHWRARAARKQAETWAKQLIEDIRNKRLEPPEWSAAHVIAWHKDLNGNLLSPQIAAVELLNILRPTIAVSVYIVFVALGLQQYPNHRDKLKANMDDYAECFVQEVRRFYPFFPILGALVQHDFEWQGYHFPKHRPVFLDIYGTNHDGRIWKTPDDFIPGRFHDWDGNRFTLIAQGGGDHSAHHRCPGEWITIALMKQAFRFFTERMTYNVPDQDLRIDYSRLPALPKSRFIMSQVDVKS